MKKISHNYSSRKRNMFVLALLMFIAGSIYSNSASAQVDYYFGQNTTGFRAGFGVGSNWLQNNYRVNSPKPTLSASLEYNTSAYFSIGIQAQQGSLSGANDANVQAQPFAAITNNYMSANMNMRFALGLLSNFESRNGLTDVIKKMYVGTGLGYISSKVTYTQNGPINDPYNTYSTKPQSSGLFVPLNIGTTLDLKKLTGSDRFELNPDYQFNMVNNRYFQGFTSTHSQSNLMFYSQVTINLKFKF